MEIVFAWVLLNEGDRGVPTCDCVTLAVLERDGVLDNDGGVDVCEEVRLSVSVWDADRVREGVGDELRVRDGVSVRDRVLDEVMLGVCVGVAMSKVTLLEPIPSCVTHVSPCVVELISRPDRGQTA